MNLLFRACRTAVILFGLAVGLGRPACAQADESSGEGSRPAGLHYAGAAAELAVYPCTPHSLRIVIAPNAGDLPAALPVSPVFVPRAWPPAALRWSGGPGSSDQEKRVGDFTVRIQAHPLTLTISDAKGRPVQTLRFDDTTGFGFHTGKRPILGLGEGGAQFDRNGKKFPYFNGQHTPDRPTMGARIAVPYLLGTEGWALLVVSSPGDFDLANGQGRFRPVPDSSADLDLIVADARDPQAWFAELAELIGRPVLPPKWALGYMQSHRTLESAAQILAEADTFRQKKLPCDALIFLGTGFCPVGWNTGHDSLEFNPKVFERPPEDVLADLHRRNFHFVVHVTPPLVAPLKDAKGKTIRLPWDGDRLHGTFQDASDTSATADPTHIVAYWQRHRPAFAAGIDGWWPDEGDWFDIESRFARARMYYEGPLADRPDRRPWNLQRNGYLGVARYGGWIWSGDVESRWRALAAQVPVGINHSLSVSPYWGTDTGGFHPTPEFTGELFVRWFQFSAFCPSFRSHGRAWQLRLPWGWSTENPGPLEGARPPPPGELPNAQVEPICRQYLELRYRLLPYTYALARQVRDTGLPLMRALWLHYPDDATAAARGDEYLWGRDLLVSPVVERGATERRVYLPAGIWYDWWTGERIEGGREIVRPVDLATLPLYVRAGAIIPLDPLRQYAMEPVSEPTTLRLYPGADGEFFLYEDQGDTNDYLEGASATIPLRWDEKARSLTLGPRRGSYPGMPARRLFRVVWMKPGPAEGLQSTEVRFDGSEITLHAPQR
ncbi:MAG TPA: TIM-barrel domain-containing protein [Chthoniobacterales bacterium]|jgi:alpha-glucosidase/alpha-D-xyloside xylohydrolase